jgi:hypothetical protein
MCCLAKWFQDADKTEVVFTTYENVENKPVTDPSKLPALIEASRPPNKSLYPKTKDQAILIPDHVFYGCKHYISGCKTMCPECQRFYPCYACHDKVCASEIERLAVFILLQFCV